MNKHNLWFILFCGLVIGWMIGEAIQSYWFSLQPHSYWGATCCS